MKFKILNLAEVIIRIYRKPSVDNSWYELDYMNFKTLMGDNSEFPIQDDYPCLEERNDDSGTAKGAYFHQDLFVAKQIYLTAPTKHVDIGSRVDGFVAHVAVFREIELLDIRKLESKVKNIVFKQVDLMDENFSCFDYCDSVSSLHALEHFGLGRYGDKIDPWGHLKGFENITRMLKKGGTFYFSVPMGIQRIEFNAHRIFSLQYLVNWVSNNFEINMFSYIDDMGVFYENIQLTDSLIESSCNCNHGCAVFVLKKK